MSSFGVVTLQQNKWVIKCEPHIRSKLKRVFARAPQQAADTIMITASEENSRDLEWFLTRYPMEVVQFGELAKRAAVHRDQEVRIADLLALRTPPEKVTLNGEPREYQLLPNSMLDVKKGLLLADDVGLGKTIEAICCMTREYRLPTLVVCLTHLPRHWVGFLNDWAPDLKVHRIRTGKPYSLVREPGKRQRDMWPDRLPDVIVINYHKLRTWAEILAPICKFVVFEECQQLRKPDSNIYQAAKYISDATEFHLGLSATPIYNYGSEFYWVMDVIIPGALGEFHEFTREWCIHDGRNSSLKDPVEFGAYLRREGFMLRRTRRDVGRELPPVQKILHTIDFDESVLKNVAGNAMHLAKIIVSNNQQYRGERFRAAGEFDAMLRHATGVAKAPYVAEFVRMLVENGEPVILYGWHHDVYKIWMEALKEFNPVLYTGKESEPQKHQSLQSFIKGESKVLIMSLRSGAGTDGLQYVCRTCVFGELDWSNGVIQQCIGRPDRDGQTDSVAAYFMLADDGADPVMVNVLGIKREQLEGVNNPDSALLESADVEEDRIRKLALDFLSKMGESREVEEEAVGE